MTLDLKKIFKMIVSVVAIILTLFAVQELYHYVQYTLPPTQVNITAKYSPHSPCRKDSPLYIAIFNDSHRQINNISFSLSVKKDGDDDNLIQLLSSAYSKDQIIAPGDTYEGCWSYPKLKTNKYTPEELTFNIKRKVITFEDFSFKF